MKTAGVILVVLGWLLGVILFSIPLVYAVQSNSFVATLGSTWHIWVPGIGLFIVLTELGKYLRRRETNSADKQRRHRAR